MNEATADQVAELLASARRGPEAYRAALGVALNDGVGEIVLDKIDDQLFDAAESDPEWVASIATVHLDMLPRSGMTFATGYAWLTLLKTHIARGLPDAFVRDLPRAMDYAIAHRHRGLALSLCQSAEGGVFPDNLPADEQLQVFKECARCRVAFGEHMEAIEVLCRAAHCFVAVSAWQSAYRALSDAQELAHKHSLVEGVLMVLETQGAACFVEGDLDCAQADFEMLETIYGQLQRPLPLHIRGNLMSVLLARDNYEAAGARAEAQLAVLDAGSVDDPHNSLRIQATITLAASFRESGRAAHAVVLAQNAVSLCTDRSDSDVVVEVKLIAVRCLQADQQHDVAIDLLSSGVKDIETHVARLGRLHYRRGARERWLRRIKMALLNVPNDGVAAHLLLPLAFARCSVLRDWSSLLDWQAAVVGNDRVPQEAKDALTRAFDEVVEHGAPVLYGFREKYDDPFESWQQNDLEAQKGLAAYTEPWRRLNVAISAIGAYCDKGPYDDASADRLAESLEQMLSDGHCIVFLLTGGGGIQMVILYGLRYRRIALPFEPFRLLNVALTMYAQGSASRDEVIGALNTGQAALRPAVDGIVDCVGDDCTDLIVLPGPTDDAVPLSGALIADERLRRRMRSDLTLRFCPIAYPMHVVDWEIPFQSLVGIYDSQSGLALARSEVERAAATCGAELVCLDLCDHSSARLEVAIADSDILHVAFDGGPLSRFTDPVFGALALSDRSGATALPTIQRWAPRAHYRFAFLNACYAATTTSHNFQRAFETDENFSYPSLLLLNRRSEVLAPTWATFDVVGYVVSHVFYQWLSHGVDPATAWTRTLADLHDLAREELIEIVKTIDEPTQRERCVAMFSSTRAPHPFQTPYCYGVYRINTLLPVRQSSASAR